MIVRQPLRDQVYEEVLRRIESGDFGPGDRLRDVNLAAELEVSRTPVREALLRLEREGMVTSDLGYGFAVRRLSGEEIRDKYPILSALEGLALRTSPAPSAARLKELKKLNETMVRSRGDAARLLELDERWHSLLLSECANATLMLMIGALKASLRRYELAYMRDAQRLETSAEHHDQIVTALTEGDTARALLWLDKNWVASMEQLATWLSAAQST